MYNNNDVLKDETIAEKTETLCRLKAEVST